MHNGQRRETSWKSSDLTQMLSRLYLAVFFTVLQHLRISSFSSQVHNCLNTRTWIKRDTQNDHTYHGMLVTVTQYWCRLSLDNVIIATICNSRKRRKFQGRKKPQSKQENITQSCWIIPLPQQFRPLTLFLCNFFAFPHFFSSHMPVQPMLWCLYCTTWMTGLHLLVCSAVQTKTPQRGLDGCWSANKHSPQAHLTEATPSHRNWKSGKTNVSTIIASHATMPITPEIVVHYKDLNPSSKLCEWADIMNPI